MSGFPCCGTHLQTSLTCTCPPAPRAGPCVLAAVLAARPWRPPLPGRASCVCEGATVASRCHWRLPLGRTWRFACGVAGVRILFFYRSTGKHPISVDSVFCSSILPAAQGHLAFVSSGAMGVGDTWRPEGCGVVSRCGLGCVSPARMMAPSTLPCARRPLCASWNHVHPRPWPVLETGAFTLRGCDC